MAQSLKPAHIAGYSGIVAPDLAGGISFTIVKLAFCEDSNVWHMRNCAWAPSSPEVAYLLKLTIFH